MLVHPIKTVVLDVFGTGKTQIAVKNERGLDQNSAMGKIFPGFALYSQKGL